MSWVKEHLVKEGYTLKAMKIPRFLEPSACLVGAPLDDIDASKVEELKK